MSDRVTLRGQQFSTFFIPPQEGKPLIVLHHGIGSSRHTFDLLTGALLSSDLQPGILTFDVRHHGKTFEDKGVTADEAERRNKSGNTSYVEKLNLLCETLEDDCVELVDYYLRTYNLNNPILMIGHSMGGTVVSKVCASRRLPRIQGLVVLDAVEGYAFQSLASMPSLIKSWPKEFKTQKEAIDWGVSSRQLRNRESAMRSIPGMLTFRNGRFSWRLDLLATRPFWDSWFAGLDKAFLEAGVPRLLILAGTGRLDKALMVGQMQGKYQLVVLNDSGHFIHEDFPAKVTTILADFWQRTNKPPVVPAFGTFRKD